VNGYLEPADKKRFLEDIFQYVASLGPIEPFLQDPEISEIMVNGPSQIYIEKNGIVTLTDVKYDNDIQARFPINHILNPQGRYVNSLRPMMDSHLPDGSRVNVVIPPISQQGSCISIRKFLKDMLSDKDLLRLNSMSEAMAEFLSICVKARLNIMVAGNTSSGKTTLLNILAKNIPDIDRIITIEDSVELQLVQTHKISLEARPPDYKGEGQITIRDLVRNSLRMRPDRIIVGEVRGGEALDMLQAMNTGHDGSMTTIHSNSPRDTLARLETITLMAGIDLPVQAIRKQIASALNLIVYLTCFPDGTRKVTQITEVVGMEGDIITLTDLFLFQQTGRDILGRPIGTFKATGLRPMFSPRLEAIGYKLEQHLFRSN
jgi:pilus assembly protein CpaF